MRSISLHLVAALGVLFTLIGCPTGDDDDTSADDDAIGDDDTGDDDVEDDDAGDDDTGDDDTGDDDTGDDDAGDDDAGDDDIGDDDTSSIPACVAVSPGVFTMGCPGEEFGHQSAENQHQVTLTGSFEIGVAEVTQSQFEGVMGWNPPDSFGCWGCGPDYPVYWVSWFSAAAFANEASLIAGLTACYVMDDVQCEDGTPVASYMDCINGTQLGIRSATVTFGGGATTPYECEGYRLPTEAEWEYSARSAGSVMDTFPAGGNLLQWGDVTECGGGVMLDDGSYLDDQAWYCGNDNNHSEPVGGLVANPLGLYDMAGNVAEWCHDWWDGFMYPGDEIDPWGDPTGDERVHRGGSWDGYPGAVRAGYRYLSPPWEADRSVGFRLARSLP